MFISIKWNKRHEQLCSILMNEQLTPRYSVMIPFMSGIFYDNIISKKDPSGSDLLYFWKLLHSSLPQIVPIHQMMFSFLSSQLRTCHKSLIRSFKSWITSWIHFDKDKDYAYRYDDRVIDRPLNKVMESHLPNFQYVLNRLDIHLCIVDQIKIIQTQLNKLDDKLRDDRLKLLQYLCISTETSDVVVQYYKQVFKRYDWICAYLLCVISVKLNEQQFTVHTHLQRFHHNWEENSWIMHSNVSFIDATQFLMKLKEGQLGDVFQCFISRLSDEKEDEYNRRKCAELLGKLSMKWNENQLERVFNALIFVSKHSMNTNNDKDKDESLVKLLQLTSTKLNDEQLYLLVIHLLERVKKECKWYVQDALLKISEDMWKRAT
ncbi:hypothetical protein RFI_37671, partial [Reticulomyxa filosa]